MDTKLTNDDLYKNKYDLHILKANIYAVSLLDILKTQTLTAEFCVKYILNNDYQFLKEDETITIDDVRTFQPHILYEDLFEARIEFIKKKLLKQRTDSLEDFETFMNQHI